jgi:hypothetical protein
MVEPAITDRGKRCEQEVIHLYLEVTKKYGDLSKYISEKVKYSEVCEQTDYSLQHVGNIIRKFKSGIITKDQLFEPR